VSKEFDADYLIVGSGFGGAASALRLTQKGYSVLMLERGRKLEGKDFPKTNWNLKRWFWAPSLGFRGLFVLRFFKQVTVLAGAGVGGGSLVYANTLPIPRSSFFENESWASLASWERELRPHYQEARRMMGAVTTPVLTKPDRLLKQVAENRGQPEAFESTHTAVFYGEPGKTVPDPYFGGEGPDRTGCTLCGACMTGCRHGSKNSLDKNYLYLAQKHGLKIQADTEVVDIRPLDGEGYEVVAKEGARRWRRKKRVFRARHVILAGGVLGTVDLLLELKAKAGGLSKLSDCLGHRVRTNSESLIGVCAPDMKEDLSKGVAIGSILQTDDRSHLEMVRWGAGSGFFRLGMFPHIGGQLPGAIKVIQALGYIATHPIKAFKSYTVKDWATKTMILLYMRTNDGTLRMTNKRKLSNPFARKMGSTLERGEKPTASIPEATELAEEIAELSGGMTGSLISEVATNIPTTAHILGGCCMGATADDGVIDHRHRVFGYPGLFVIDGSAVSANPGVNPSLTILALAERAMSFIPPKSRPGEG
jgi:cholesterol oxidase